MGNRLSVIAGLCLFVILPRLDALADGERPWAFSVGVNGSFNDNRDGVSDGKESTFDSRVSPRADFKLNRDQMDFDFYYSPQFCYRTNPREAAGWAEKTTDLYHDLGLNVTYRLSKRLSFSGAEAFNLSDAPADLDTSRTFHEYVTYWVNRVSLAGTYEILPQRAALVIRGNQMMKRYREDAYADIGDEKSLGGGLSARYMLKSGWTVVGDVAYGSTDLGDSAAGLSRSADVLFAGAGVEKVFGLWSARVRIGVDRSEYDISVSASGFESAIVKGSTTQPGGDIEIAYSTESGRTRIGLATAYHTIRSDIEPFAVQQRTSLNLQASHSFSERIRLAMNGVYGKGEYSGIPGTGLTDGSDVVAAVGTTFTYIYDRNLSLEATYRFEDWSADANIRESYRRNVGELALKAQF